MAASHQAPAQGYPSENHPQCNQGDARMKVTVIWHDIIGNAEDYRIEVVEIRERKDGNIYREGLVRQAMRQQKYTEEQIDYSIKHTYEMVGIIKGEAEWLT
jgi:hypothetical protein